MLHDHQLLAQHCCILKNVVKSCPTPGKVGGGGGGGGSTGLMFGCRGAAEGMKP